MAESIRLAARLDRVSTSQTQQVLVAVERLRRQNIDVIDLGAGEPDFPTPGHIKAAGAAAIQEDFTKYTAGAGILELREALAQHYTARYGVDIRPGERRRDSRRQASALQHGAGAVWTGRRGDHARPRVAVDHRADPSGRRRSRPRAYLSRRGVRASSRACARRGDGPDAWHRDQQSGEPDRRGHARNGDGAARRRHRRPGYLGHPRSLL